MSDLISSAPGIFQALNTLCVAAGAAQSPTVPVYAFALTQQEPASYVLLQGIENHTFEWGSIGPFAQKEHYDITGQATVFSGSATPDDATIVTDILNQTYSLFQSVVMTPVMSNRTQPLLGTTGPSPYLMLPGSARYSAGPGSIGGGAGGWGGVIEFSFHFDAYLTPA